MQKSAFHPLQFLPISLLVYGSLGKSNHKLLNLLNIIFEISKTQKGYTGGGVNIFPFRLCPSENVLPKTLCNRKMT